MNQIKHLAKQMLPLLAALSIFFVASALYFAPQFGGKRLQQHDTMQYDGMAQEIKQMRAETGEDPQWTGAMFGGMPAYLIDVSYPAQLVVQSIGRVKNLLATPMAFLFFAMLSMWIMLRICRVNPYLAIVPALAYGFSTYFPLIIAAGHVTKMWAMVWAPLMMGGAWMTMRHNKWYGAALTAVAASLQIGANHPQITYYFLMAMAAFWISEGVSSVVAKRFKDFLARTALLAAAGLVALFSNFAPLWYTMQHTPETIRGGSELVAEATSKADAAEGLDLDYATAWSYGIAESWNMLIPDFAGRESATTFSADGPVAAAAHEIGLDGIAEMLPTYWGGQPYTAGPTYLGAAIIFLAVLGLILTSSRNRWWVVAVLVVMIFLAWGRNFMGFTEWAFNYLPGYNKFRTVSMTLCVVQWIVPLLAALGLYELLRSQLTHTRLMQAVAWAAGCVGGLALLMALFGGSLFSFGEAETSKMMVGYMHDLLVSNQLQEYINRGIDIEWGEALAAAMVEERISMMQADAVRSALMVALAAGGVLLFVLRRIGKLTLALSLAAVVLIDLVPVDLRFVSHEDFQPASRRRITATAADRTILADKEPGFRVLNLTVSPFNDATTSYFHRSVGGYHGAKLARYQDLIDRYLGTCDDRILDMLNTRYLIIPDEQSKAPKALRRGTEFGPAWFVEQVALAPTAEAEITMLGEVDLRKTAVVAGRDAEQLKALQSDVSNCRITLEKYQPNHLTYRYESDREAIAVFSEIFYDKGWKVYIDGVEAPYLRANYVLRAMELPAGNHTVEWHFRAPNWTTVEAVTLVASLIILLGGLVAVWIFFAKRPKA